MIDIHCHLLPGIDDGPETLEASFALAQALVDDGVTDVVCTPHVFPGRFENWRSSIAEEFDRFNQLFARSDIALNLLWAGEVRLSPEVLDLLARDELPFLGEVGGLRTMLLEMPDGQIPIGSDRFIDRLRVARILPVLVHPERNRAVMSNPERIRLFVDMGCQLQLTAGSLTGHFGASAQRAAQALLDQGWVHAVASDAHNLGGRRPRMTEAFHWLLRHYGEPAAMQLLHTGPRALIEGNASRKPQRLPPTRHAATPELDGQQHGR